MHMLQNKDSDPYRCVCHIINTNNNEYNDNDIAFIERIFHMYKCICSNALYTAHQAAVNTFQNEFVNK